MNDKLNSHDRITRQRVQMLMHQPFFGVIGTSLEVVEMQPGTTAYDTMATDGKHLFYNDNYVKSLTDKQLVGLLVHEVLHVTNLHAFRRGHRDMERWNDACDGAIDWMAKEAGYDVPNSFADIKELAWMKGKSAEEIYEMLPPSDPKKKPGQPRPGGVMDSEHPAGSAQAEEAQSEVRITVRQAALAQQMKQKGTMPAWMKNLIEDVCEPKMDWKQLLANYVAQAVNSEPSWDRPSRKHIHSGMYLPGMDKEGLGEILIYNDTSGSMHSDRSQMFAELKNIFEEHNPEILHVIDCDADVGRFVTLEPGDFLIPEVMGGGGSDFRPAFKEVKKRGITPMVAIVLSDMEIAFPNKAPPYPVIGISTTAHAGPEWMKTVFMHPKRANA